VATYWRYRIAAWSAFDTDLRNNLDTLQGAFLAEVGGRSAAATPPAKVRVLGVERLREAARGALAEFRLNGLYAEIRTGSSGEVPLARIPGAGVPEGGQLLGEEPWREIALSPATHSFSVDRDRRATIRSLRLAGASQPISLAVADSTALVELTLRSIRRSLLELGAGGLFLALVGGSWLAARALRPIATLTTQADQMAAMPSGPGSRLDIANPDDELGRLAATFNRLLARIESSVEQMKGFIADAAHELKTPVTVVRTEAELSLSTDRTREDYREALRAIAAESTHLSRLVSDLTLLAEGQTLDHPVERRLVDLNELAHEVTRALRSVAAGRGIALRVESDGGVEYRGDERLLRQIFMNLVENAIKFSRPGGSVGIALENGGEAREIRVFDEAPTLSESDRERVFERFYRSPDARGSDTTGSGLGLAIVQWAVKLHGGRIYVEPRELLGNAFVVVFPSQKGREAD